MSLRSVFVCASLLVTLAACGDEAIHKRTPSSGAPLVSASASASVATPPSPPPPEHSKLAIVAMGDDLEAFAAAKDLPVGGTLLQETVPMGSSKQEVPKDVVEKVCVAPVHCEKTGDKTFVELPLGATHNYLRVVTQPGESIEGTTARTNEYLQTLHLPAGARFAIGRVFEVDDATKVSRPIAVRSYIVRGDTVVSEKDIVDALAKSNGPASIQIKLGPDATKRFESFTRENEKRRLGIIVDDVVVTAPVVQQAIPGGELAITLSTNEKATPDEISEATRLAKALRPPHG